MLQLSRGKSLAKRRREGPKGGMSMKQRQVKLVALLPTRAAATSQDSPQIAFQQHKLYFSPEWKTIVIIVRVYEAEEDVEVMYPPNLKRFSLSRNKICEIDGHFEWPSSDNVVGLQLKNLLNLYSVGESDAVAAPAGSGNDSETDYENESLGEMKRRLCALKDDDEDDDVPLAEILSLAAMKRRCGVATKPLAT